MDETIVAELAQGGADRFPAAPNQVRHFLMGQLGPQPYPLRFFHAVALAQLDKQMSQARRHVPEHQVLNAALDLSQA